MVNTRRRHSGFSAVVLAEASFVFAAPAASCHAYLPRYDRALIVKWGWIALDTACSAVVVVFLEPSSIILTAVAGVTIAIIETGLADNSTFWTLARPPFVTNGVGMWDRTDCAGSSAHSAIVGIVL